MSQPKSSELASLQTPLSEQEKRLCLHHGRQTQAYTNPADVIIYGGAAGGGKTEWLLKEAIRYFDNPNWVAKIFRRTYAQVTGGGGIWQKTYEIYPLLNGKPNNSGLFWTFPSGAHVGFGHLQHEHDMYSHQGKEYPLIGFDELDHFLESQFWYLFSRNRSTCGVREVIRCTTNPNPDHFIKPLILWWLDSNGQFPDLSKAGVIRWFVRDPDDASIVWHDSDGDHFWKIVRMYRREIDPDFRPTSLTFIPASVDDNPSMPKSYKAKLMALPFVERQRLLYGDWLVKPSAGMYFKRHWFNTVIKPPRDADIKQIVRYWDRAATAPKKPGDDPDWTAGVLMARTRADQFYILDLVHFRGTPLEVEQTISATSESDRQNWGRVQVALEQDPGQAGKAEISRYQRMLAGHNVRAYTVHKDKRTRAEPLSAQTEAQNVYLLERPWNEKLLNELEGFPDMAHDDIVDACSGAFNAMTQAKSGFVRV